MKPFVAFLVALVAAFGFACSEDEPSLTEAGTRSSPSPTPSSEKVPKLIDDGVVSLEPRRFQPGDEVRLRVTSPPGGYGLAWFVDRKDGGSWEYVGGFKAGPKEQWEGHREDRFYFNPTWKRIGIEDIGFNGSASLALKVPRLKPGEYRIAGAFYVEGEEEPEWHSAEFTVTQAGATSVSSKVESARIGIDSHCGLSRTVHFVGRHWLPANERLRRTTNPPPRFHPFRDRGTMKLVEPSVAVYTSSQGRKVRYEPTKLDRHGCS